MEIILIPIVIGIIILIFFFIMKGKINDYSKHENVKEESFNYNNFIDKYEYHANLWTPLTSLEALNHHGEKMSVTSENELPQFSDSYRSHGVWLPLSNDVANSKKPIKKELRELEYLKKFRKTYESDLSHDQKFEIISALFGEYNYLPSNLIATDWYLWELMEISGISLEISKVLYKKGITTKQGVKLSSDKDLLNIPGIGQKRLKQIKAYFSIPKGS